MLSKQVTRRELLRSAGLAATVVGIAACQPKVVEVEKVVERTVEVEVEKVVERTVEVEVEKIVEVEKAPSPTVTIRWMTPAELGLERTMYINFTYMFAEENPGIKVEPSFEGWDDYQTKLPTVVAAGNPPDVIHTHRTLGQQYAYRGVLSDHVPWAERDNLDLGEFIPELLRMWSHGDKVYSLPKDSAVRGIYYNKDMFDEAGVEYPDPHWTWEDFKRICIQVTRDFDGRSAEDPGFDASNIKQWGCTFLSLPNPEDGQDPWVKSAVPGERDSYYTEDQRTALIDQPEVVELFQLFADLRCVHHAMPTPAEALGMGDQWRAGLCAMCHGHHSTTFFAKAEKVRFNYDVNYVPAGPYGQFAGISASAFGVTSGAQYPEEGWLFVKFITSKPIQTIIGEQKRWGVPYSDLVQVIEPTDGIPEHFAMVHTDPFKPGYAGTVKPWGTVATPIQSRFREIMETEFDAVMTCGDDTAAAAAARAKPQLDAALAEVNW